jgi:acyl carrier protein
MTREELIGQLAKWIAEITDGPAPALTPETDLAKDAGLDSLALAELAARVRQTLKIRLRPTELGADLRVGRLADLVLERLAAPKG